MYSTSLLTTLITLLTLLPSLTLSSTLSKRQTPPCVMQCMAQSTKKTDCATVDFECLCTNQKYVNNLSTCFFTSCSNDSDQNYGAQFAMGTCYSALIEVTIIPSLLSNATITPGGGTKISSSGTPIAGDSGAGFTNGSGGGGGGGDTSATSGGEENTKSSDGVGAGVAIPREVGCWLLGVLGGIIVFGWGV